MANSIRSRRDYLAALIILGADWANEVPHSASSARDVAGEMLRQEAEEWEQGQRASNGLAVSFVLPADVATKQPVALPSIGDVFAGAVGVLLLCTILLPILFS